MTRREQARLKPNPLVANGEQDLFGDYTRLRKNYCLKLKATRMLRHRPRCAQVHLPGLSCTQRAAMAYPLLITRRGISLWRPAFRRRTSSSPSWVSSPWKRRLVSGSNPKSPLTSQTTPGGRGFSIFLGLRASEKGIHVNSADEGWERSRGTSRLPHRPTAPMSSRNCLLTLTTGGRMQRSRDVSRPCVWRGGDKR